MRPSIYIETTIISYLTARPSRDVVRHSHQIITREWWRGRNAYDLFTSQFVIDEAQRGARDAAVRRLRALSSVTLLEPTDQIAGLAGDFEVALSLPPRARADALHLAISVLSGMQFLLTWNCKHLANGHLTDKIESVCSANDLTAPQILTPEQLLELP